MLTRREPYESRNENEPIVIEEGGDQRKVVKAIKLSSQSEEERLDSADRLGVVVYLGGRNAEACSKSTNP
jgi:hypothetical protein